MKLLYALLLMTGLSFAQLPDAPSTADFFHDKAQVSAAAVSMTLRVADLSQTIHHLDQSTWYQGKEYHGRETWLPTQNHAAIAAALLGSGLLTTYGQLRLYRSGHKRTAIAVQMVSSAISGVAIYRSFHSTYTVSARK